MSIEEIYSIYLNSTGVCTDTRNIQPGNLFFALKGPNFNGNQYAAQALRTGAIAAVIDEPVERHADTYILVNNVLTTLQLLARHHRRTLAIPVVAVCGSNGKTTTKELIFSVLSRQFNVFATKGNLNNHIGVPLSLLAINNNVTHAIIEMGANHLGETAALCRIAEPNYGIITNNGYDHLEGYGTIENVKKANGELYDYLKSIGGTAFVNAGDADLMLMSKDLKRITYGSNGDVEGHVASAYPFISVSVKDISDPLETQLAGDYNLPNILCAIAIGRYFGLSSRDIIDGIASYYPKSNRSQWVERGGNNYLVDCYNANPSSMEAALRYFYSIPGDQKIAILGDMYELGDLSNTLHRDILNLAVRLHFNKIILVGKSFAKANSDLGLNLLAFESTPDAKAWLDTQDFANVVFLLKGSRGVALEGVVQPEKL